MRGVAVGDPADPPVNVPDEDDEEEHDEDDGLDQGDERSPKEKARVTAKFA